MRKVGRLTPPGVPSGAAAEVRAAGGVARAIVAARRSCRRTRPAARAREDVVRGDEVVVLAMRQRADDGELVRPRRQLGQVLAGQEAGRLGSAIGLNSPRISSGASGFGSKVSRWLAAPVRNTMRSDFGLERLASDG